MNDIEIIKTLKKERLFFHILSYILIFVCMILVLKILYDTNIKNKENLSVLITPEERLEAIRRVEMNEKWFEGYKQGQIDAIKGYIYFELKKNENGEVVWEHNPKRRYNK